MKQNGMCYMPSLAFFYYLGKTTSFNTENVRNKIQHPRYMNLCKKKIVHFWTVPVIKSEREGVKD